jgi:CRP-like cAMP-binding protein
MFDFDNKCNCLECFKKTPLFYQLTDEELHIINRNRFEANYKAGETIFKQGTAMTHLMSFRKGLAKVYIEGVNNRNLIMQFILPTNLLGGPGFKTDNRYHYTIVAVEDSEACFIDIKDFEEVLLRNNEFALLLIAKNNKQSIYNFGRFISLTQKQMPGRIADALLYISQEVYKSNDFETRISRQDIADLTALTKESTIRILKQFKNDKIIEVDGNHFRILDLEELKRISLTG